MDDAYRAFTEGGIAAAVKRMGRSVTFPGAKVVFGVRTELQVDPGELEPGGHRYTRAFALNVPNPDLIGVTVKKGLEVVDDTGVKTKILRWDVNHIRTRIFFASVHS